MYSSYRNKCTNHNVTVIPMFRNTMHMHNFPLWKCPECDYTIFSDAADAMLDAPHDAVRDYTDACTLYLREV